MGFSLAPKVYDQSVYAMGEAYGLTSPRSCNVSVDRNSNGVPAATASQRRDLSAGRARFFPSPTRSRRSWLDRRGGAVVPSAESARSSGQTQWCV